MDDFFHLDQAFTDEERMVRDAVAHFVAEEAAPLMMAANENAEFPMALIARLGELGVLGMRLPASLGGAGASAIAYGLVCQELEKADSALRSFMSVQSSLCMYPIYAYGTQAQQQAWLPKMAQGKLIGCFGLTEAGSGSDPGSMKTTAHPKNDGWVLNGSKMWITNAPIADVAIIWAKAEEGIRGFLVEKERDGFSIQKTQHKFSLRASATGEIFLDDCWVPAANLLPGTDKGLAAALGCLNQARYGISWGAMGAAMSCYQTALDYLSVRHQFGQPLTSNQLIQKDLADMLTEIVKAQTFNLRLGQLMQAEQATPVMISMGKMNACREALKIARMARNLMGASGISLEYPVIRHLVNLESVFTYEGTDNIHHLVIGQHITGINAF